MWGKHSFLHKTNIVNTVSRDKCKSVGGLLSFDVQADDYDLPDVMEYIWFYLLVAL